MDDGEGLEDLIDEVTEVVDDAEPLEEESEPVETEEESADDDEAESASDDEPDEDSEQTPIETLDQVAAALEVDSSELMANVKGTVVVNGETQEVTLQEALRGYQRQMDYDQGRTALRQERDTHLQEVAQHHQSAQEELLQRGQFMQSLKEVVTGQMNDPRIQALQASQDPAERLRYLEMTQEHQGKLQAIAQLEQHAAEQWQANQQQAQAMQQQYQQQHLEQQQAQLLQAVPDFNNEKAQAMTQYLRGLNFTDEEIGTITDHRMVMVALKAQAYDEQQKSVDTVKKKVSKLPKITKPGKPESKAKVSRGKRARLAAKAKQTGHPDDAAAAIEHLI